MLQNKRYTYIYKPGTPFVCYVSTNIIKRMKKIRIVISGIGGVGGYYGGKLAAHYQNSPDVEICFISRGENLHVIKEKGLRIETPEGVTVAQPTIVTNLPAETGIADFLICCTKSYDLEENIRQLSPVIGTQTSIIPLLNGANITERIQQVLPQADVWKGCTYIGARISSPGIINRFTTKERFFFGSETGSKEKQQIFLKLLTDAGINAFNPEDITAQIWKKFFMISIAATITSYYNQTIGEVIANHYDIFVALGNELKSIAQAKGVILPEDIVTASIESQKMMPANATTSMHSDFIKGGNTELDTLTGYVVKIGEETKTIIPLYKQMYSALTNK